MLGKVLLLPGDGIGPEVMREVRRVMDWFARRQGLEFELDEGLVGGTAYDQHGTPLTDEVMAKALEADAVLFGAVGGPKYDVLPFEAKPERGLLRLRKEMELFANLRPAKVFDALADSSSLKPELVQRPRPDDPARADRRHLFRRAARHRDPARRLAPRRQHPGLHDGRDRPRRPGRLRAGAQAPAASCARSRRPTSWNPACSGARRCSACTTPSIGDVELSHMYADNCAMQLVRQPKQFDVIVTDNLFGDILSDCAAMLTGSLGMLPSASLGAPDADGKRKALYEPVHGSAPDIAGKASANPIAMLLSFSMMLRYSFDQDEAADLLDDAIGRRARGRPAHRRHHAAGQGQGVDVGDGRIDRARARQGGRLSPGGTARALSAGSGAGSPAPGRAPSGISILPSCSKVSVSYTAMSLMVPPT